MEGISKTLASARQKLAGGIDCDPYPLEDLPTDRNDDAWQEIRGTYGLKLPELVALKNSVHQETPRKKPRTATTVGSPTPGRTSDRSREAADSFLEEISMTSFGIRINGISVGNIDAIKSKIKDIVDSAETDISNVINLEGFMEATKDYPDLEIDMQVGIRNYGETAFKKSDHFQSRMIKLPSAHAMDNSDTSALGPFFKPPQEIPGVGHAVYEKTAKVDVTSTIAPMDLEIKGEQNDAPYLTKMTQKEWQVLKQVAERTRVRLHLAGYLSTTVAFAVTDRFAWCVLGIRYFDEDKCHVDLCFWRIHHASIARLWMGVTRKAASSPYFFLTEDGKIICGALTKIGVIPWCCRVNVLAVSQSVVYGISLPFVHGSSISIDSTKIDYAVKVVREDSDNYNREVDALKVIAQADELCYAIGHVPQGGEAELFRSSSSWQTGAIVQPPLTAETNLWWWKLSNICDKSEGGAIFMKYGYARTENDDLSAVWLGACQSLQYAHASGILHCDIRESNILYFDDVGWRLVDFGLSCRISDEEYPLIDNSGAQSEGVGPRLKLCLAKNQRIQWSIGDDYEMLMQMFRVFSWRFHLI